MDITVVGLVLTVVGFLIQATWTKYTHNKEIQKYKDEKKKEEVMTFIQMKKDLFSIWMFFEDWGIDDENPENSEILLKKNYNDLDEMDKRTVGAKLFELLDEMNSIWLIFISNKTSEFREEWDHNFYRILRYELTCSFINKVLREDSEIYDQGWVKFMKETMVESQKRDKGKSIKIVSDQKVA